jgi:hypothetical protein
MVLIILFYVVPHSWLFSQTFNNYVQDYTDEISKSLPFAASMGLNWSNPYIGQLLGHPVHFGVGVSLTGVYMSNAELSALGTAMGMSIDDSSIKDKQWLPNYVLAARLGGLGGLPFDFGFKFGYLPDMPMWGSLDYHSMIFGFDINYAIFISRGGGPIVVVGAGYDMLEGGVSGTAGSQPTDVAMNVIGPAHLAWKSNVFKAKALFSQPIVLTALSVFGGIDLGFSSNEVGVKFGSDRNNPIYEVAQEVSALAFSSYVGLGLEINAWHIDLDLMVNFVTFELGFNIGFRYQR